MTDKVSLLMAAKDAAVQWYQTPGAVNIRPEYAQVHLEVLADYCQDKNQWVLVKRMHKDTPYELRCVIDANTGYYIVALVFKDQIGFLRDTFGPTYPEIAISFSDFRDRMNRKDAA